MAIIGIDFDGTTVTHDYPEVGHDIGAQKILKELIEQGHELILWTMRSKAPLQEAVNWFHQNNIPLVGINENPDQHSWTSSPKAYCHVYIDDAALGTPLIYGLHERPFVDWQRIRTLLVEKHLLPKK